MPTRVQPSRILTLVYISVGAVQNQMPSSSKSRYRSMVSTGVPGSSNSVHLSLTNVWTKNKCVLAEICQNSREWCNLAGSGGTCNLLESRPKRMETGTEIPGGGGGGGYT